MPAPTTNWQTPVSGSSLRSPVEIFDSCIFSTPDDNARYHKRNRTTPKPNPVDARRHKTPADSPYPRDIRSAIPTPGPELIDSLGILLFYN